LAGSGAGGGRVSRLLLPRPSVRSFPNQRSSRHPGRQARRERQPRWRTHGQREQEQDTCPRFRQGSSSRLWNGSSWMGRGSPWPLHPCHPPTFARRLHAAPGPIRATGPVASAQWGLQKDVAQHHHLRPKTRELPARPATSDKHPPATAARPNGRPEPAYVMPRPSPV